MHLDLFTARLRQVLPWTERLAAGFDFDRGDYGTVFRQLNPLIDGRPLYAFGRGTNLAGYDSSYACWNVNDYSLGNYRQALRAALAQRVAELPAPSAHVRELAALGRILLFETQCTTHDRVAIAESRCFVDESEVPPIDTWFHLQEQVPGYHNPMLYCWIPRAFEPVMQDAIDVEMLGSYHWLDEADPRLHDQIRARL
jgi:hypothetical protein